MAVENTQSQMRKGILEYCVMLVISRGEIYSSDIIGQLTQANMLIAEGTLYPLLTRLKNAGLLAYAWKESTQGPPRKYFTITEPGKRYLNELDKTWADMTLTINQLKK
jgi:PadR family transcriptional regulator PadR